MGRQAQALNLNAVSVGNESKAKGEDTVAIGTSADAVQNRAMAIGKGAVANGADTYCIRCRYEGRPKICYRDRFGQ